MVSCLLMLLLRGMGWEKQARRLIHADGTTNTTAARVLPMVYSVGVIKTATKVAQICER